MWRLVVLGVVGACYAPALQEGLPCGAGSACPTGMTCSPAGTCTRGAVDDAAPDLAPVTDAPVADAAIDGPSNDVDGDGILNAADNCPMKANPGQYDEDGDMVGNDCDSCPHVDNTDQTQDADQDGVGDACDPRPGQPDELVYFNGFDTPLTGWTTNGGTWTVSGGLLTGAAPADGAIGVATYDQGMPANLAVATRISVTAGPGPSPLAPNGGVLVHATATDFYRCGVVTTPRLEVARHNGTTQTNLMQATLPSAAWTTSTLQLVDAAGALTCTAERLGTTQTVTGTDATLVGDKVGFRVRESTVTFRYLAVFELK